MADRRYASLSELAAAPWTREMVFRANEWLDAQDEAAVELDRRREAKNRK